MSVSPEEFEARLSEIEEQRKTLLPPEAKTGRLLHRKLTYRHFGRKYQTYLYAGWQAFDFGNIKCDSISELPARAYDRYLRLSSGEHYIATVRSVKKISVRTTRRCPDIPVQMRGYYKKLYSVYWQLN